MTSVRIGMHREVIGDGNIRVVFFFEICCSRKDWIVEIDKNFGDQCSSGCCNKVSGYRKNPCIEVFIVCECLLLMFFLSMNFRRSYA